MRNPAIILILICMLASCGSHSSSSRSESIDGTYVYQDGYVRSKVTIYGDRWRMKTQFGLGSPSYDHGEVRGSTLYYSGLIEYGKVSGKTLNLAGKTYSKQ